MGTPYFRKPPNGTSRFLQDATYDIVFQPWLSVTWPRLGPTTPRSEFTQNPGIPEKMQGIPKNQSVCVYLYIYIYRITYIYIYTYLLYMYVYIYIDTI